MKLQELQQQDSKEIIEKSGHHQRNNCTCVAETDGGNAYRDIVVKYETNGGDTCRERYYHQSRVVSRYADNDELQKIDVHTHGYGSSSTTRERINKEMPSGFRLVQRDYVPMLSLPSGDRVSVPKRFTILYDELEDGWIRVADWNGENCIVDVSVDGEIV